MKKNKLSFVLFLFVTYLGVAQEEQVSKKELRKERPTGLSISLGTNNSNFRDFATSPLIYRGRTKYVGLSRVKSNQDRESEIGASYSFGKYNINFNDHSAQSKVNTVSISYSQLYGMDKLSSEKLKVKVGGMFNATGNLRTNESLQNNALGIEFFPTIFGSGKVTKDISRTEEKNKKFLFVKYKLKPRTRNLSFRLNVGLINSTLRTDSYVYAGQSGVLNDTKILDNYKLKVFSGFRMSTALNYTVHLNNKNEIQLSYIWDAYKTGGDLDQFEMANHICKLTFFFNTNNK